MDFQQLLGKEDKLRIIQETVPGRQITLAHIIAGPDAIIYKKLGLDPRMDYARSAIGILTITPSETAIIAADISIKASGVELGFVDRFSGTVIVTGSVSDVEASLQAVLGLCPRYPGLHRLPRHQDLRSNAVKKIILMAGGLRQDHPHPGAAGQNHPLSQDTVYQPSRRGHRYAGRICRNPVLGPRFGPLFL